MKKLLSFFFVVVLLFANTFAQNSPSLGQSEANEISSIAKGTQDSKLLILEKPTPDLPKPTTELPNGIGSVCVQGIVTVRAEFLSNGKIGTVVPISSLPYGLTESAIEAAKKIKFVPEVKNGAPVTVKKSLQYGFMWGWMSSGIQDEKAEAIIKKAVERLGGDKYLQVKTVVGTGNFSTIRDGVMESFTTFIDVISYPDKERTEFKQGGIKNIQTNYGTEGWIFDGGSRLIKEQNKKEVEAFQRSLKTSLDNLLRGAWRKEGATLKYIGRREAGLGKRNEAIKIIYKDGFEVEFEFDPATWLPAKTLYKRVNAEGEEQKEEDRYAQFVDVQGISAPFIIDHWVNGKHTSRINYVNLDFNKSVPDAIFKKPADVKELKKDLKL